MKRFVHFFRGRFNAMLYFCWVSPRDIITFVPCHSGWNSNFELYGGTSQSNKAIKIYEYVYALDGRWSTNLFFA